MRFSTSIHDGLKRSSLLIAYLCLVVGAVVAFMYMQAVTTQNQAVIERVETEALIRAYQNCESINDTKILIGDILDRLSAPREGDEPGDFEERQRLRRELDGILTLNECPPLPGTIESLRAEWLHEDH